LAIFLGGGRLAGCGESLAVGQTTYAALSPALGGSTWLQLLPNLRPHRISFNSLYTVSELCNNKKLRMDKCKEEVYEDRRGSRRPDGE